METWLDLHMHTKYSMDGQFEPADLMRQCADAGVTTVGRDRPRFGPGYPGSAAGSGPAGLEPGAGHRNQLPV